ncbi:MAG: hypothetical protein AUJ51_13645 [Elusimicrobia bacterium CG1_02_56_21]|nr:MAG: hypothetical protein AUJ51_13645 [Elusimicrobia bacterium CG1_02_56_21]
MKTFVKKMFALALFAAAACAHAPAPGSFNAAPEFLTAEGSAVYDRRNPGASREKAVIDAEKNAVRRAAALFMDEDARAENYSVLELALLKTPQLYVAKRKILSGGQDGGSYRVQVRVWVFHDKIASALRSMNLAGSAAGVAVAAVAQSGPASKDFSAAFREAFSRRSSIAIKDFPFTSDAALLSGPESFLLEAASSAGADLLFLTSASAAPSGAGLNTGFYPSRAEASVKVYEVETGRELLALGSQANAIDSSAAASVSKALASAGELLAVEAAGKTGRQVKRAAPIKVAVMGLSGLEVLEKLKAQLLRLDLKSLQLESYSGGTAIFSVVPGSPDPQEFASVVLRGDSLGLEMEAVGAQEVAFSLPR